MIITETELAVMAKRPVDAAEAVPVVSLAISIIGGYLGRELTNNEPWRVKEAILLVATRLLNDGGAGEIVSETIGSYTYSRARTGNGSRFITPDIAALLAVDRGTAYCVDTPSPATVSSWPPL